MAFFFNLEIAIDLPQKLWALLKILLDAGK